MTTPRAQASCLHLPRGGGRQAPPPRNSLPHTPGPLFRTTFYDPFSQQRLNPLTEPVEYEGERGSTSTQSEDPEEQESVQGSTVGTQTEREEVNENRETSTPDNGFAQMSRSLAEALSLNRLPIQEPQMFYGDSMSYPAWRASFKLLIERQAISADEKLNYLQRFLGGPARDAVEGLFLMGGAAAYEKALEMLEERFGCHILVAGAFLGKFDEWPVVKNKDGEGLRKLSDFLQQCLIAIHVVGHLEILDNPKHQRTLTVKLPDWLQRGWLERSSKTLKKTGSYPPFSELAGFIKDKADTANDPVFSMNVKNPAPAGNKPATQVPQRKPTSFFVSGETRTPAPFAGRVQMERPHQTYHTGERKPPCGCCESNTHNILSCKRFLDLDPAGRIALLLEKKLCFSCAMTGQHWTRACPMKPQCRTCGYAHLTELHGAPRLDLQPSRGWSSTSDAQERNLQAGRPPFPDPRFPPPRSTERNLQAGRPPFPDPRFSPPRPTGNGLHFGGPLQGNNADSARRLLPDPRGNANRQGGQGQPTQGRYGGGGRNKPAGSLSTSAYRVGCGGDGRTSMMIPVLISSVEEPQTEIKTYVLLDTMSSVTFVKDTIAQRLKVKTEKTALCLNTMTSHKQSVDCRRISGLQIRAVDSHHKHPLPEVFTTTNLSLNPDNVPTKKTAENYTHLRPISQYIPEYDPSCEAGLLIGYDNSDLLMPLDVIPGQPFAVQTVLGWSIVGQGNPPPRMPGTYTMLPTLVKLPEAYRMTRRC
eukprot:TRINITY_DN22861_c0_g1_i1.p2 TRINITY_DN22861_c0_g1~~TRINITY_DN22861_c0_g1_i1.p2  ORF type:complete len:758 (-),score=115.49 TRINITY_DN22861_c0_g1_i1:4093-6366(-)